MQNQFEGMTDIPFTYEDFERTRMKLIEDIKSIFTEEEKHFLVSFELGEPDWSLFDYPQFADYPSVQWKLKNLQKLKQTNPTKLQTEADKLQKAFSIPTF